MDSQIDTGGGAAVQGNVNAGRDVIGRDQTINNIVVLSNFLHYAQVEGLFPKIQQAKDFSSLTEVVESALDARLNSDLAEATAFAGEVLGDFIEVQILSAPHQPTSLPRFVADLVTHISKCLRKTGYWDAYSQSNFKYDEVVWLEAASMLWDKQFPSRQKTEIFIGIYSQISKCFLVVGYTDDIRTFNTRELRVLIAGIVLDLIRIGADARITTEYLKSMAEQFRPK